MVGVVGSSPIAPTSFPKDIDESSNLYDVFVGSEPLGLRHDQPVEKCGSPHFFVLGS
jgi:hypothetical protein